MAHMIVMKMQSVWMIKEGTRAAATTDSPAMGPRAQVETIEC